MTSDIEPDVLISGYTVYGYYPLVPECVPDNAIGYVRIDKVEALLKQERRKALLEAAEVFGKLYFGPFTNPSIKLQQMAGEEE